MTAEERNNFEWRSGNKIMIDNKTDGEMTLAITAVHTRDPRIIHLRNMDVHYDFEGASKWLEHYHLHQVCISCSTIGKVLQEFIKERHNNDINQLTCFDKASTISYSQTGINTE
jgi:hypothetical protein